MSDDAANHLPAITPPPKGCELLRENVFEDDEEEPQDPELLKRRQPTMLRKGDTLIGPQAADKKYTVVFDLDETVIYARDGPLYARAYLKDLFRDINKYYEVVVWTAGERDYAKTILEEINEEHIIRYLIYRDEKWFDEEDYTKDLRQLGRNLDYTIIIENTPDCVRANPRNGIIVEDFEVLQPEDSMGSFESDDTTAGPPPTDDVSGAPQLGDEPAPPPPQDSPEAENKQGQNLDSPALLSRTQTSGVASASGRMSELTATPPPERVPSCESMHTMPRVSQDTSTWQVDDLSRRSSIPRPPPLQSIQVVPPKASKKRRFPLAWSRGRRGESEEADGNDTETQKAGEEELDDNLTLERAPPVSRLGGVGDGLDTEGATPAELMLTDVETVTSLNGTMSTSGVTAGGTKREVTDRTLFLLRELLLSLAKSRKTVPKFLDKCPLLSKQVVEGADGSRIPIFHLGTRRRRKDAGVSKKTVRENRDRLPKIAKTETNDTTSASK